MIVPKDDARALLRGEVAEVLTGGGLIGGDPLPIGETRWVRTKPTAKPVCQVRVVDSWPLVAGGHAMLVERVAPPNHTPKEKPPKPRLRLNRGQRYQLFAGGCPKISGDGPCPVEKGTTIRLSARIQIEVLDVRPTRGGGWSLHYQHTRGDQNRLLRRGGGYTSDDAQAVDEAGEAPPAGWRDPGIEARAKQQVALERAIRDRMTPGQQLDALLNEAKLLGADLSVQKAAVERRLVAMERKNQMTRDGSVRKAA